MRHVRRESLCGFCSTRDRGSATFNSFGLLFDIAVGVELFEVGPKVVDLLIVLEDGPKLDVANDFDSAEYVVGEDRRLALQPYALPRVVHRKVKWPFKRRTGNVERVRRRALVCRSPALVMFRLRSLGVLIPSWSSA
jgi:hypothetical protein